MRRRLCAYFLVLLAGVAEGLLAVSASLRQKRPLKSLRDDDAPVKGADLQLRLGHGYDIHRMAPRSEAGQPVVISGVRFDGTHAPDFELGVEAHSDGDVVYHSVVDPILGALCLPDIGQLFPDNDPRLKGADSTIFMEEAVRRMRQRGYALGAVQLFLCQS